MLFGPDGNLYVLAGDQAAVLRYNGQTGAFLDMFVTPGSGGLRVPVSMAFGPDGDLYVANTRLNDTAGSGVLRFDGTTGAFLSTFVSPGSGGLLKPLSVIFGPGGDLYVGTADTSGTTASPHTSAVLRYDGTTGAFLCLFVPPDSGARYPTALIFSETDPVTRDYVTTGGQDTRLSPVQIVAAPDLAATSAVANLLPTRGQWDPAASFVAPRDAEPWSATGDAMSDTVSLSRATPPPAVLSGLLPGAAPGETIAEMDAQRPGSLLDGMASVGWDGDGERGEGS
jgi:hypothetical protein